MTTMRYEDFDHAAFPDVELWGEDGAERLSHDDIDEAIEAVIDAMHPHPITGTVEITGFARMKIDPAPWADSALCLLVEGFDEEFSNYEDGPTDHTDGMRAAAAAFVDAVMAEYTPWACEGVVTVTVDARAWTAEHNPVWLADPHGAK